MNVLILFGGISPEHTISVISAQTIVKNLSPEKYTPILLGISPSGKWRIYSKEEFFQLQSVEEPDSNDAVSLTMYPSPALSIQEQVVTVDCAFPVLHGAGGEDGTIQGLLASLSIPYVGCNVESSAICMNKILTKEILLSNHIPVTPFETITIDEFQSPTFCPDHFIDTLGLPLFIKVPHGGSSIGVTKINRPDEFYSVLSKAFNTESTILLEQSIEGREIECSILTRVAENGTLKWMASCPGEVIPEREFYDYTAKYLEDSTQLDIPASLSEKQKKDIQDISLRTAKALSCYGMVRVDCFIDKIGKIMINEVNTIPAFTSISMYPSLWNASGIHIEKLLDDLIHSAICRKERF